MPHSYFGLKENLLKSKSAYYTAKEITGQPDLWLKTYSTVKSKKQEIQQFLNQCYGNDDLEIILTGAGTSAFIGDVLEGPFQKRSGIRTRAIATTDLVTHADQYFFHEKPILLISFARSGNSPESVAVVDLANEFCQNIYHFIVTCSPDGALAQKCCGDNCYVFLLPPESDDQSLAMTGSFTAMLLAGVLFSLIERIEEQQEVVQQLSASAEKIFDLYLKPLEEIAKLPFDRAVFLGSGSLKGIACESHLKLQELSDGAVICKYDSFLGFRHGPKAVINDSTLIAFLFSNDDHVHQYERDLVVAINAGDRGLVRIGIGEKVSPNLDLDLAITLGMDKLSLAEEFLSIVDVIPAQILGFLKSLNLGLEPDRPSASGTITRVVEGVTIYPNTNHVFAD